MSNIIKFDAEMFEGLLEVAASSSNNSGSKYPKKVKQNFVKHPGIRFSVSNGPGGGLAYKRANKKGILIDKVAREVRGVVLDSKFSMAQWGKDDKGKAKMLCSTISHTTLAGTPGDGTWQIPLRSSTLTERLNPQGFKGMSCADCMLSKGNEGCKQSGAIHILVTGLDHGETDEDDNFIGIQDIEPFIAHISSSGMSAFQYSDFLQQAKKITGQNNPDSLLAIFSTQDNPKAPVKMLKIDPNKPYSTPDVARKLLSDELDKMADDEAKRLEEWKIKNGVTSKGGSSKTASGDDDLPF